MKRYAVADAHCDFLYNALTKYKTMEASDENGISLTGLIKGNVKLQVFAAWCGHSDENAFLTCMRQIDIYEAMLISYPIFQAFSGFLPDDNSISTVLSVEGGCVNSIDDMDAYKKRGIKLLSLTWNNKNSLAGGVLDEEYGLSPLGREIVQYMNQNSIFLDVSHLNRKSFWDICHLSDHSFMASHSNAFSVCNHMRNLNDDQIKEIIRRNGFLGIAFYPPFLGYEGSIETILRHIDYILSLGGENVLGFGSDFDGIEEYVKNLTGSGDFSTLISRMQGHGYSDTVIKKICSGNLVRVLSENIKRKP